MEIFKTLESFITDEETFYLEVVVSEGNETPSIFELAITKGEDEIVKLFHNINSAYQHFYNMQADYLNKKNK